jgi:hypothetical protein
VVEFATGASLQEVAALLYQVEVGILGRPSEVSQEDGEARLADARSKTLLSVLDAMVDGSTPPTALPFLTTLVQSAAPLLLVKGPYTKVRLLLQSPRPSVKHVGCLSRHFAAACVPDSCLVLRQDTVGSRGELEWRHTWSCDSSAVCFS